MRGVEMTTTTNTSETLDEMVTSYMNASDAAYETLEFLVDVYGTEDVLNVFFRQYRHRQASRIRARLYQMLRY